MKMRNKVKEIANGGLLSERYKGQERVCCKVMQHASFMYKKRIESVLTNDVERGNLQRRLEG